MLKPTDRKKEQNAFQKCLTQENPWKAAQTIPMVRHSYKPEGEELEPGVRFFILALEALGAKTKYSCEGHHCGFYIAFIASHKLARQINSCGFFSTEIEKDKNYWSIRLTRIDIVAKNPDKKNQTLTWAAQSWAKTLFPN